MQVCDFCGCEPCVCGYEDAELLAFMRQFDGDVQFEAAPVTLGERLIPGCTCGWPERCRCD